MASEQRKKGEYTKSWIRQLLEAIPLPPSLTVSLLWVGGYSLFFVLSLLAGPKELQRTLNNPFASGLFGLLACTLLYSHYYCETRFEKRWASEVSLLLTAYDAYFKSMFRKLSSYWYGWLNVFSTFLGGIIGSLLYWFIMLPRALSFGWWESPLLHIYGGLWVLLAGAFLGAYVWFLLSYAITIRGVSTLVQREVHVYELNKWRVFGRLALTALFFFMVDASLLILYLYIAMIYVTLTFLAIITISVSVIGLVFFYATLSGVHVVSKNVKQKLLRKIDNMYTTCWCDVYQNLSTADISKFQESISFLQAPDYLQKRIKEIGEWPYDFGIVKRLIGYISLPSVILLILKVIGIPLA